MQTTDRVQTSDSVKGTSTGTSTSYTYSNRPYNAEKGWECPRCGRINAPWVRQCDCTGWNITCSKSTIQINGEAIDTSDTFKIHPDQIVYTTSNHTPIVGGSDYWDSTEKIWSNVLSNVSNIKEIY